MQKYLQLLMMTAILILLSMLGCNKNDAIINPSQKNSVLLPLSQGNQWKYLRVLYDSSGVVSKQDTIIRFILKDSLIFGVQWAYEPTKEDLYRNDEEGLWEFIVGEPRLIYRYPSVKGTEFNQANSTSTVVLVSTDTIISTNAGTFKCYHYILDFYGIQINHFISPDVGFIKMEYGDFKIKANQGWSGPYFAERDELISTNVSN